MERAGSTPARVLIALIGIHSCVLGVLMLAAPHFMLRMFGFPAQMTLFFTSQSGIFLLILGILYLLAIVEPAFIWSILISKLFAVPFLVVHAALLGAPLSIWAAAAGDGFLLLAMTAVLMWPRQLAH